MRKRNIECTSPVLGESISIVAYGSKGLPVMVFGPEGTAPSDLVDEGVAEELSDYLADGAIRLFLVGDNNSESWLSSADPAERAARQEAYYQAVCEDVVPLVQKTSRSKARPLALGFGLGATHAAIFALRRPDLFQGCVCLSGSYDAKRYFGDWMDAVLYDNAPCAFLPNMAGDHPYVSAYGGRQLLFCCGQSEAEATSLRTTRLVGAELERLGVDAWCDYWGADVTPDWFWWKKQLRYFMPIVLEDVEKTTAAEKPARKPAVRRAVAKADEPVAAPAKPVAAKVAPAAKKAAPAAAKKAEKPAASAQVAAAAKAATAEAPAPEASAPAVPAKPAPVAEAPLAKAEKPAVPAKAVKAAVPAKTTKAAVPAKAAAPAPKAAKADEKPAASKPATPAAAKKPATKAGSAASAKAKKPATAKPTRKRTTGR